MKAARILGLVPLHSFALFVVVATTATASETASQVHLVRTPDNGIQPQAAVDSKGVVHLIYLKGESNAEDIFYVRREPGQSDYSKPIQVNTRPHTAMAMGTIRGAQLAIGKNERVHVVWDGMGKGASEDSPSDYATDDPSYHATDAPPAHTLHAPDASDSHSHSAQNHDLLIHSHPDHLSSHSHPTHDSSNGRTRLYYTRLNDAGTTFEPERNVITYAYGLDGGSSVAADLQGNVYVTWHAEQPGNTNEEGGRAVFVARSTDGGQTFQREAPAISKPTGACGCCGMRAFADSQGNVLALYRAAYEMTNRDETLLISRNRAADFEIAYSHQWHIGTCPMSSASLSENLGEILAAAETHGRVFFVRLDPKSGKVSSPVSPETQAKHPVAIGNTRGEVLLAWAEGTGWNKGGSVAWRVYDREGKPLSANGRADGLAIWSLPTAFAEPNGTFTIIY